MPLCNLEEARGIVVAGANQSSFKEELNFLV